METLPPMTPEEFDAVVTAVVSFLAVCGAFKLLRKAFR